MTSSAMLYFRVLEVLADGNRRVWATRCCGQDFWVAMQEGNQKV
jgi:hypothetical protein